MNLTIKMKKTISLLLISLASALDLSAQTTSTLGLPGFNNSFGPLFSNQLGGAITTGNLNQLLLNIQADLSQILPVLTAANDGFDFTPTNANTPVVSGIGSPASAATGTVSANTSPFATTPFTTSTFTASPFVSSGTAGSLGTVLGQDLTGANAVFPGSTALGNGLSPALTPIAGSTGAVSTTVGTGTGTGSGLAFTSRRDVLRALIILQDDVEQMLPLVNALNGGNTATLNTLFTNSLGTTNLTSTRSVPLTPTGR